MHISHSSEDDNLKRLLSFSIEDLQDKCGYFDIEKNGRAKELVFERTRYTYNDALEYFDDNFLSQITSLGLSIALKEGDPDEAV
ncbi:phage gp6-like head-tail connector protein [Peribacillus sp. TH27]|uniref:phage gp6-like head-tail connector protein n=1 Tax=Peribacillus sp. TH27 TaxID=2798484 RepID=UPI00191309AC|nr:phage gp6-like head-tail connector protein [Peribacillus sp. TH27]MBK5459228.1 phage gp6-like head-tail connector protein [Peribacillus sp. TH27]